MMMADSSIQSHSAEHVSLAGAVLKSIIGSSGTLLTLGPLLYAIFCLGSCLIQQEPER